MQGGDGTKLLLNNRPAESGALRFEIVSLDLCRIDVAGRIMGKNSGRLGVDGFTLNRDGAWYTMHIGIGTCDFDHALSADQHNTPLKPGVQSALGIRTMGTELAVLLTAKALGS
jgi:hypothetical protein